ncbi:hypothetical protein METUNv1_03326 [Methyloversatilis universalis FAM5]|uniref:Uncharacterized protein n=1 Tax=Methyloversatilis universalis (strain ATCC BAA-1314 / DSM 25237 / JCM 13912 / CCUG 52030 / FAM5) TaxID=1000565 RepID=F5RGN3_METUF|nr:hypothetical protein METUNv1_03326 [Methyloversatilis universalis FAM5]
MRRRHFHRHQALRIRHDQVRAEHFRRRRDQDSGRGVQGLILHATGAASGRAGVARCGHRAVLTRYHPACPCP